MTALVGFGFSLFSYLLLAFHKPVIPTQILSEKLGPTGIGFFDLPAILTTNQRYALSKLAKATSSSPSAKRSSCLSSLLRLGVAFSGGKGRIISSPRTHLGLSSTLSIFLNKKHPKAGVLNFTLKRLKNFQPIYFFCPSSPRLKGKYCSDNFKLLHFSRVVKRQITFGKEVEFPEMRRESQVLLVFLLVLKPPPLQQPPLQSFS